MKLRYLAVLAALAATVAVVVAVGTAGEARAVGDPATATITVSGTGVVTSTPDRAGFSFGVENQGGSASAALSANSAAMRRVIAALRGAGVPAADLQTEHVSLEPRYDDDDGDGDGPIVGYVASNAVSAVLRNVARSGAVIDAAVSAGATNVSGPALFRADQQALGREALTAAVADARGRAETIARAAGVALGRVVAVAEAGVEPQSAVARSAAPEDAPVEPGTQTVEASVTVTFALGSS